MDDYLTDKEQVERLRQWWRENGWFLIGGVALGGLAIVGYRQYFEYRDAQSEQAAAMYQSVKQEADAGNTADAETRFATMRSEFPDNAYTHQAALLLASNEIVTAPDDAAEKLRFTMENSDDPELAMVARLRLARVLAYRDRDEEALAVLNVPDPGQFAGRIAEIKGDIHAANGETDAARTAYLEAMVAPGAELLDRGLLQMKLSDLPGAAPPPSAEAAPATSAPDVALDAAEAPADAAPGETAPAQSKPEGE
ncbi:MAG TPA: tetratricopeptide repeat protein [Gammaproteobacteria bacterium]|nr:tetratricopeptide repeat protein [Gammaproteobacteria bacterium]